MGALKMAYLDSRAELPANEIDSRADVELTAVQNGVAQAFDSRAERPGKAGTPATAAAGEGGHGA
jgi:hypothetical protein